MQPWGSPVAAGGLTPRGKPLTSHTQLSFLVLLLLSVPPPPPPFKSITRAFLYLTCNSAFL